jgi:hypothetical protein
MTEMPAIVAMVPLKLEESKRVSRVVGCLSIYIIENFTKDM